ncbi:hypothetical protein V2G26_007890 [Clonostachys chloroleuca]
MASVSFSKLPEVTNEPNHYYEKGSFQRVDLVQAIEKARASSVNVPLVVGGQEIHIAARGCSTTRPSTSQQWPLTARPALGRATIFLKAADLISKKYRYDVMAATILGQGKNAWQAEIDSAAELADFLRFNVHYAETLYSSQPSHHSPGVWNRVEYRSLEGFVYAVSPFNFTAIGGNLATLPALLGNVVLWKPSDFAIASNFLVYKILLEAGLPGNVIQWIPGDPTEITQTVFAHPEFAALHYTGSTAVFRKLYGEIGRGIADGLYKSYPRVVGETGGKNAHLIHHSADIDNAVIHTVRGAFEYQGQKCSATSRVYISASRESEFKRQLVAETKALCVGDPASFETFIGLSSTHQLSRGFKGKGYFVQPTIYRTTNPNHKLLSEEFFGPILVVYVYDDKEDVESVCKLVDETSEYGLTCAVFASDRQFISFAENRLRDTAGNFYINCKSTGAVVGQQPFGGGRASGTNDKAGSINILSRFVSMRSIKEEFNMTESVVYPSNVV